MIDFLLKTLVVFTLIAGIILVTGGTLTMIKDVYEDLTEKGE